VAVADGHLHPDDDRLLPDIEVAEAADQAHAVHLAGALLETANQEHPREGLELLLLGEETAACHWLWCDRGWPWLIRSKGCRALGLPLGLGHAWSPLSSIRWH